ncbi:MAG: hypothetical protein J6X40_08090 [Bacteroidales bacterium]|nr:hypothetical protein [Bacteroidales bacterium]
MKRLCLLLITFVLSIAMQAQWVDNPTRNTRIGNCNHGAADVYVATDHSTGDTYVQWHYQGDNGWSPWLQRLNFEGVPQWPEDGIHITTPDFATWSPGYGMTAVEGGVVSVFRTLGPHHWAVKINADGTFPWGAYGLMLFNGEGGGRSEVLAGDDGGVWALGTDMDSTFLQYVNADGTLRTYATIKDPVKKCSNGVLVPANNGVFVVYSKHTLQGYTNYNKEIYVAGYNKDGEQIVPETLLFGEQTVGSSYVHYAVSDGMGGGYVYQWHNAIGSSYNVYVTHFSASGTCTVTNPDGIPVHSYDPYNNYTNAYATIDPVSKDLLLAYIQRDAASQAQYRIYMNRFTPAGERIWDEGILVADFKGYSYSDVTIDALEYGGGFAVTYGTGQNHIEAVGLDDDGNRIWSTNLSTTSYSKTIGENSSGFYRGQNIVAWINTQEGGVYGQNIGWDGTMGEVTPPIPPEPCYAPTDFQGDYYYDEETTAFGIHLSWTAPQAQPLHYNLYFTDPSGCESVIEIAPTETTYLNPMSAIGYVICRLTAVYEDCESGFAQTETGADYLLINVTSVQENLQEEIVTVTKVFTMNGQWIRHAKLEELSHGVYVVQGWSSDGKLITKKIVIK